MNVMIYNKYRELLTGLKIETMKTLEGVYNVDEIIDAFANFYHDKMIIDITAIRDYQNTDNLQKLAMNFNMDNVVLLLDDSPETNSKDFTSKLVSMGIYNFTKNPDGVKYLMVHPHTYKDAVEVQGIDELPPAPVQNEPEVVHIEREQEKEVQRQEERREERTYSEPANNGKLRIIGFKDVTMHAGATSLIYMIKKELDKRMSVSALEVNRVDFLYFNDPNMVSTTAPDLLKEMMKRNNDNVILIDLNDYEDIDVCSEVYYLLEPSTLMLNKMMKRDKSILEKIRNEKIILNRCMLSKQDITTFEYETKLKIFFTVPCLDDRQETNKEIRDLLDRMKL